MVSSILKYAYDNVFVSFKEICQRNQSLLMENSFRGLVILLFLFQYFFKLVFLLIFHKNAKYCFAAVIQITYFIAIF